MVKNDVLKINVSDQILLGVHFKLIEKLVFKSEIPDVLKCNVNSTLKALKLFEQ